MIYIRSDMIKLLNLKGLFAGLPIDDKNIHIVNFCGICTSYNLPGVSQDTLRLKLLLFTLTGEAILWLG